MGNCLITVHVTGIHHNNVPADIDQMASKFVDDLAAKGHNVTAANICTGGDYNLLDKASRFPIKDGE